MSRTLTRTLAWLVDYWWIPALVLVGVGISLFGRRAVEAAFGRSFQDKLTLELDAIGARREVREIQQKQSHDQAVRFVKEKYALRLAMLEADERKRARELEDNPQKLAEMMTRLGR